LFTLEDESGTEGKEEL